MSEYRVIPMQCGDEESYALLFHESDGAVVVDIYDTVSRDLVQTLKTPFPVGGVDTIHYIQSFDVVFFAQPDTYPCKLQRKNKADGSGYEFSFENNEFLPEPILEWNEGSSHTINVFAIPKEDTLVRDASGKAYHPAGTLRSTSVRERVTVAYSHYVKETVENESGESEVFYEFYGVAYTDSAKRFNIGDVYYVGEIMISFSQGKSAPLPSRLEDVNGNDTTSKNIHFSNPFFSVTVILVFNNAKVFSIADGVVYFYLGKAKWNSIEAKEINNAVMGEFVANFTENSTDDFYVAIKDAPEDIEVTNTEYYRRSSGDGIILGMTIDGTNENENMHIGQMIALKYKSRLYHSKMWDYTLFPVGNKPSANPPVDTLPKLPNKTDWAGRELRPVYGGGFGEASDIFPVRGKVNLKTEGRWSGVIELQEIDKNGSLSTIATISSENALSNTDLSRDIDAFGSSVRVACTRREQAYEVNKSVNGDGLVMERVLIVDDGCQWTLSSDEVQTAYMRVVEKKTLTDGRKCYVCKTIGGVNGGFSTNSYALGAWCRGTGYPSLVTIYQERLVYAKNKTKPMTIWMSKTNKWTDFELGTLDSSSISATLATEKYDTIQWMFPNKNGITVGSQYSEFSIGSNDGKQTTSDNLTATVTSSIGSDNMGAEAIGTATIMVKTGGKELYRIDYNTISEEASGNQVSMLASHLFENDKVVKMFTTRAPSNMLFCLHESGKLSSLTYEPDYGVTGWARHHVLDGIEDGCVFRRFGKDVLCLVVRKGGRKIIGELDMSADVWTDDGEPYESSVVTTPISVSSSGSAYGKKVNIAGCDVYVGTGTKRFNARLNGGDWVRVDNGFDADNNPIAFPEQRVELPTTGAWVDEAVVEIRSDAPYPLVLHGIGASIKS